MTPELAKLKQREDARRRSKQAPRRASSQAVSSDQSEVTEEAPAVYRVPQINVPEDLQGAAKLIQTELAKIEQSQSILLSLWEKVKDQANSQTVISFSKPITGPQVSTDYLQVGNFINQSVNSDRAFRISTYQDANGNYVTELIGMATDGAGNENAVAWIDLMSSSDASRQGGSIQFNCETHYVNGKKLMPSQYQAETFNPRVFPLNDEALGPNDNISNLSGFNAGTYNNPANANATPENGYPIQQAGALVVIPTGVSGYSCTQIYYPYDAIGFYKRNYAADSGVLQEWEHYAPSAAIEADLRLNLKKEIYAELLELNPGIVIPQTD